MSKRRQKVGHNIKRVVQSDRDCMKALHDVNCMKREHLNEFISDNRIQKLEWDKVIEHKEEPGTGEFIWTRGEKYDEFVSKHGMEHLTEHKAIGSSNHDGNRHHDLAMANHYCFNMTQEERDSVRTESQQRDELEEYAQSLLRSELEGDRDRGQEILQDLKEGSISMCDMAYTTRDEQGHEVQIGYEVTTDNYTKEMVQAKESYCSYAGLHFVSQNV